MKCYCITTLSLLTIIPRADCQNFILLDAFQILWNQLPKNGTYKPTLLAEDIICTLFTRSNPINGTQILSSNIKVIDPDKPIKYLIHGFMGRMHWYKSMTDAYLRKGDYQVIHVDWSVGCTFWTGYMTAMENTKIVEKLLAKQILKLHLFYKVKLSKIHMLGLSLGSHIAGMTGKTIMSQTNGKKIARITGLDPAGPLYEVPGANVQFRLSKDDAEFVDVTHSDCGLFGYTQPLGHIDFYSNGGRAFQPGCIYFEMQYTLEELWNSAVTFVCCSHEKSIAYYMESIESHSFLVEKCYGDVTVMTDCENIPLLIYGEDTPIVARGIYYFKTNAEPPYGQLETMK